MKYLFLLACSLSGTALASRTLAVVHCPWIATFNIGGFSANQGYQKLIRFTLRNVSEVNQSVRVTAHFRDGRYSHYGSANAMGQFQFGVFEPVGYRVAADTMPGGNSPQPATGYLTLTPRGTAGEMVGLEWLADYRAPAPAGSVFIRGSVGFTVEVLEDRGAVIGAYLLNANNRDGGIAFDVNTPATMSPLALLVNGGRPF